MLLIHHTLLINLLNRYLTPLTNMVHLFVHPKELHTSYPICSTMYVPLLKIPNHHLKVCYILFLFPCLIQISLHHIVTILCLFYYTLSLSLMMRLVSLIVGIKLYKLNSLHLRRQTPRKLWTYLQILVRCRWVYKIKHHADGTIGRSKLG